MHLCQPASRDWIPLLIHPDCLPQLNGTTTSSYWHSTGLYASPGTVVTVTLPNSLLPSTGAISFLVGCHTDGIWHKADWPRMPEMTRRWVASSVEGVQQGAPQSTHQADKVGCWGCCRSYAATGATTKIGNALGGLIYVILPSDLRLGPVSVTITGGRVCSRHQAGQPSCSCQLMPLSLACRRHPRPTLHPRQHHQQRVGQQREGCTCALGGDRDQEDHHQHPEVSVEGAGRPTDPRNVLGQGGFGVRWSAATPASTLMQALQCCCCCCPGQH